MTGVLLLAGALAAGAVLLWPSRGRTPAVEDGGVPDEGRSSSGWLRGVLARRRSARERPAELALIDGLAAALEAGLPVPRAVGLAVRETGLVQEGAQEPVGSIRSPGSVRSTGATAATGSWAASGWAALGRVAAEGQELAPAWQRLARQTGSPAVASVARAWRVATLTGAPLASALRVSAHVARERHRLARAVEVATAGPRATVAVLTLLPVAGAGLAAVMGVGPASLYGHPVAQASAGTGALLILLGQVWVRRMVADVVRRAA